MTSSTPLPLLRLEVARLRSLHSRRRFDSVLHLGRLGAHFLTVTVGADDRAVLDAGTRTEVVETLLDQLPDPGVAVAGWVFRPGEPLLQDEDLAWYSATRRATEVLGRRLDGFWAITRTGWLDVPTGATRTWKRLRL